jgi:hypothetical protein
MMAIRFEESRDAINVAVAKPIPEEPPVMRTVLFLRLLNEDGSTVKVEAIVGEGAMFALGVGVYQYKDIKTRVSRPLEVEMMIYKRCIKVQTWGYSYGDDHPIAVLPARRRCLSAEKTRDGLFILRRASG